jgi:hypothetical protein
LLPPPERMKDNEAERQKKNKKKMKMKKNVVGCEDAT